MHIALCDVGCVYMCSWVGWWSPHCNVPPAWCTSEPIIESLTVQASIGWGVLCQGSILGCRWLVPFFALYSVPSWAHLGMNEGLTANSSRGDPGMPCSSGGGLFCSTMFCSTVPGMLLVGPLLCFLFGPRLGPLGHERRPYSEFVAGRSWDALLLGWGVVLLHHVLLHHASNRC